MFCNKLCTAMYCSIVLFYFIIFGLPIFCFLHSTVFLLQWCDSNITVTCLCSFMVLWSWFWDNECPDVLLYGPIYLIFLKNDFLTTSTKLGFK